MEEEKRQTISVRLNGKEQKIHENKMSSSSKDEVAAVREDIVKDDAPIILNQITS